MEHKMKAPIAYTTSKDVGLPPHPPLQYQILPIYEKSIVIVSEVLNVRGRGLAPMMARPERCMAPSLKDTPQPCPKMYKLEFCTPNFHSKSYPRDPNSRM